MMAMMLRWPALPHPYDCSEQS
eukprot:COSAG04_NODE_28805_length_273_cov_0.597701_1_plen_21_part_10